MIKSALTLFWCLLVSGFCSQFSYAAPSEKVVLVGVSELKPLCPFGKDCKSGIIMSLLREIAAEENWDLRIVSGSLRQIRKKLEENEIDLAVPMFFSRVLNERFEFSQQSIISTWAQVYAPANKGLQSLLDLNGLSIGVKQDDPYNQELRQTLSSLGFDCRFVEFNRYSDIFKAIEKEWIEAGVVDRLNGFITEKKYRLNRTPIILSPTEIRFAAPQDASSNYLNIIDYHLSRQKKDPDSTYNRQIAKIFGESSYEKIPKGLIWTMFVIIGFLMILLGFVLFLKQQVRLKTAELVEKNNDLKKQILLRSETEEKYRSVFENTGTATMIIEKNATASMANQKAAELFGYGLSEFNQTMKVSQSICPEHRQHVLDIFRSWRKTGTDKPLECEFQIVDRNGTRKEVLARFGRIPGSGASVVSLIDITERKQKENERIQLATAVEQSSESMAIIGQDRTIEYVNPAFEKISGYRRQDIMGKTLTFLHSESHDAATMISMEKSMKAGRVWRGRLLNKRRDGSEYLTETTISPIFDADGHIINYVNLKRDITIEAGLEEQLKQSQKLQAIGQLAGGIAHDFNNILTSIMGNTELLLFQVKSDGPMRQRLINTLAASERAKEMINQILMFSHRKEQVKNPVEFNPIIEEALNLIVTSAPSTIAIERRMSADECVIMADPTQVHQIVMNLCTNAIHAMDGQKGTLKLTTDVVLLSETESKHYLDLTPGTYARLSVSDSGRGMDAQTRERIFEPFFSTKNKGEGTGMGLSVVHGIVKSHSGTILVESEPGKGACFQVLFPKIEQNPLKGDTDLNQAPEKQRSGKILVVDDEKEVADVCVSMLQELGYKVVSTTSSKKALAMFQAAPNVYDLVVTDQTMPELTGMDLSNAMLAIRPDLPIVLCTGYSEHITAASAQNIGIKGFASKPYRLKNLAQLVDRFLNQSPNRPESVSKTKKAALVI